jgi:hypothetical protein
MADFLYKKEMQQRAEEDQPVEYPITNQTHYIQTSSSHEQENTANGHQARVALDSLPQ